MNPYLTIDDMIQKVKSFPCSTYEHAEMITTSVNELTSFKLKGYTQVALCINDAGDYYFEYKE